MKSGSRDRLYSQTLECRKGSFVLLLCIRNCASFFLLQHSNAMSCGWLKVFVRKKNKLLYSGPTSVAIQPDVLVYKNHSESICSYRIFGNTFMIKFKIGQKEKTQTVFLRFLTQYDFESAKTHLTIRCLPYFSAVL